MSSVDILATQVQLHAPGEFMKSICSFAC